MTVTAPHRQSPAALEPLSSPTPLRLVADRPEAAGSAVTVAHLMSSPHVAEPDAPLLEIIYRMLSLGQREIVVVSGKRPLGVITAAELAALADPGNTIPGQGYASDLLASRTARLLPDQDLVTAASTMIADDAEALPVVDYAGTLVGILASRHIIDHLGRASGGS